MVASIVSKAKPDRCRITYAEYDVKYNKHWAIGVAIPQINRAHPVVNIYL